MPCGEPWQNITEARMSSTPNHTSGIVHLFNFEPDDGVAYRVQFGRLPPTSLLFQGYIVFGFAEGRDALITVIFDTDHINDETFGRYWRTAQHIDTASDPDYLERTAYTVFAALVGLPDIQSPAGWNGNWRSRLPITALS
jgi:hypothetical protein